MRRRSARVPGTNYSTCRKVRILWGFGLLPFDLFLLLLGSKTRRAAMTPYMYRTQASFSNNKSGHGLLPSFYVFALYLVPLFIHSWWHGFIPETVQLLWFDFQEMDCIDRRTMTPAFLTCARLVMLISAAGVTLWGSTMQSKGMWQPNQQITARARQKESCSDVTINRISAARWSISA